MDGIGLDEDSALSIAANNSLSRLARKPYDCRSWPGIGFPQNLAAGRHLSNEGPTPALVTAIKSEVPHRPLCLSQVPASADSVVGRG